MKGARRFALPFAIAAVAVSPMAGALATGALSSPPAGASPACTETVDASSAHGTFTTIQGAIDASSAGDTICVWPGLYNQDQANNRVTTGSIALEDFNILVDKAVTIQGLDASGNPITSAPEGQSTANAPVIEANRSLIPVFGSSNIFVEADNATIRGLEINGDPNLIAKSLEISANNVTVTDVAFSPSTAYSGAGDLAPSVFHGGTGIYISDFNFNPSGGGSSEVQSYTFTNNTFDGGSKGAGIYIANGAGWSGPASGRVISGNKFSSTDDAIDLAGPTPPVAWLLYPVGAPTITGNTFADTVNRQVLVWGTGGPGVGYISPNWCGLISANTFDHGAFTWQGSTVCPGGTARTWAQPSGSGGGDYENVAGLYSTIEQYGIAHSVAGDTVQVLAGTYDEPVTIPHTLTLLGAQAGVDARARAASESILTCSGCSTPGETPLWVNANDVTINGFTITGNTSNNLVGAGVYLQPHTHGTQFVDNIVSNNIIGLYLENDNGADPTLVQHNLFENNTNPGSASGTDIYADNSTAGGPVVGATIDANRFTNSSFVENGWAVDMSNVGSPQFSNIVVSNNSVDNHGRGFLFFATTNSSVTGNTFTPGATNHYAVSLCGGVACAGDATLVNSNISVTQNMFGCASCNGSGVVVDDLGASGISVNRNDLHGLVPGINNLEVTPTVDGTCNWWGSASGPAAGQSVGAVNASTWLDTSALNGSCGQLPGAPTESEVSSPGTGTALVRFAPGDDNGSPITSYTVTCVSLSGRPTVTATGSGSPVTVTGLAPGMPYACSVTETNVVGTSAPSNVLSIIWPSTGVPSCGGTGPLTAPTLLTSAPGNAYAPVSWAPVKSCIAGYVVTPYLGSVAQTPTLVPGHGTTTVVSGLVNGDTYTFTVSAEDGVVEGPASSHSTPITVGAPAAAAVVSAAKVAPGQLEVTFKAPSGNGANITSYAATCKSSNGGRAKSKAGKASPIVVTGLTKGKTYTCSVKAVNRRGTGPASHATAPKKA